MNHFSFETTSETFLLKLTHFINKLKIYSLLFLQLRCSFHAPLLKSPIIFIRYEIKFLLKMDFGADKIKSKDGCLKMINGFVMSKGINTIKGILVHKIISYFTRALCLQ